MNVHETIVCPFSTQSGHSENACYTFRAVAGLTNATSTPSTKFFRIPFRRPPLPSGERRGEGAYIAVKYTLILGNSVIAPALLYLLHPCSRAPGVALPPASMPSYPSPCGLCLPEGDGAPFGEAKTARRRDPPFGIGGRGMRKNLFDGVLASIRSA